MSASTPVDEAYRSHRPYLINLAYQMLGDIGEAEDVVQETFLRLARVDATEIDDVRAWLTVAAGRLCLDQIRSARMRHEQPDVDDRLQDVRAPQPDPADRVTLDDQVSRALLEVLRRLSPAERVAFVLHDIFGMPFAEIADTVGRSVGTCRQLARRARAKFTDATPRRADINDTEHRRVVDTFITACANGDLQALTAVLDPAVWGAGTILGADLPRQINRGADDVAVNLLRYLGRGATLVSGPAGQPVLLAFAERRLFAVLVLTIRDGRIFKIEASVDPSAAERRRSGPVEF